MSTCCKDGGACTNCGKCKPKKDPKKDDLKKSRPKHTPDEVQLFLGVAYELQHTDSLKDAQKLARDHLGVDPNHYLELLDFDEETDAPYFDWKEPVKKGRKLARKMKLHGLDISIETDKGDLRHWYDPHNKEEGTTKMKYPYGYICRTEGADDEQVDVYVGPNHESEKVFIVHQKKAPDFKRYDEDKVMLGFTSPREAKAAYLEHYNKPGFFGSMTNTDINAFKRMFVAKSFSDPEEFESLRCAFEQTSSDSLQKGLMNKLKGLWRRIKRRWKGRKKQEKMQKRWVRNPNENPCKTGVCRMLEGVVVDIDDEFPYAREMTGMGMHGPPAHGHCRCTLDFIEATEKSMDAMTLDEQDMTPMMPMQQPAAPFVPMMVEPHDVETFEGVMSLLGRVASASDEELMTIAGKIWGNGYSYEGQAPEQARAEILGFLLDQRDLLGIAPETVSFQPSQSLLEMSPPSQQPSQESLPPSPPLPEESVEDQPEPNLPEEESQDDTSDVWSRLAF
jgi:hypothetical protein